MKNISKFFLILTLCNFHQGFAVQSYKTKYNISYYPKNQILVKEMVDAQFGLANAIQNQDEAAIKKYRAEIEKIKIARAKYAKNRLN